MTKHQKVRVLDVTVQTSAFQALNFTSRRAKSLANGFKLPVPVTVHHLVCLIPRPPTKPPNCLPTTPPVYQIVCPPLPPSSVLCPIYLPTHRSYPTLRQPSTPPAQHTPSPQTRLLVSLTSHLARQPTQSPTPTPVQYYACNPLRLPAHRPSPKRQTITFYDNPPALPITPPAHR